jgi:hypothetical protein
MGQPTCLPRPGRLVPCAVGHGGCVAWSTCHLVLPHRPATRACLQPSDGRHTGHVIAGTQITVCRATEHHTLPYPTCGLSFANSPLRMAQTPTAAVLATVISTSPCGQVAILPHVWVARSGAARCHRRCQDCNRRWLQVGSDCNFGGRGGSTGSMSN